MKKEGLTYFVRSILLVALLLLAGVTSACRLRSAEQTPPGSPQVTAGRPEATGSAVPGSGVPYVIISSPEAGRRVEQGQEVKVQSESMDEQGISRLDLLVDDRVVRSDEFLPQPNSVLVTRQTWIPDEPGTYTLRVRAFNAANRVGQSGQIVVRVVAAATTATPQTPPVTPPLPLAQFTPLPTKTPTAPQAPAAAAPTPTPGSPAAATPTPAFPYLIVKVSPGLNVREGPGTQYRPVGLLQTGDMVRIRGQNNLGAGRWWQIGYDAAAGWPVHNGVDWSLISNWQEWYGFFQRPRAGADFQAVYDEGYDEGVVRSYDSSIAQGAKFFAFGFGSHALSPDLYTDDNSGYVEIHGGVAPTFADSRRLEAGASISWDERWYPVAGLGSLTWANQHVALYLEDSGDNTRLHLVTTQPADNARVLLLRRLNNEVLYQAGDLSIGPDQPYHSPLLQLPGLNKDGLSVLVYRGDTLVGAYQYEGGPIFTPTPGPTPTPEPVPAWQGRLVRTIPINGWSSVVRIWVRNQIGLPVTFATESGNWRIVGYVGTKPEYGVDALEFAPLVPGNYIITPQGLGATFRLELPPGSIAEVVFDQPTGPSPTPTNTPVPSPTATLRPGPSPTASATSTPSVTAIASPTSSLTPTPTATDPPTLVSTSIATDTPTPTPTATPGQSPTPAATTAEPVAPTFTVTPTPRPSDTVAAPAGTPSATALPQATVTATPTVAVTSTPTPVPTATPTVTDTPEPGWHVRIPTNVTIPGNWFAVVRVSVEGQLRIPVRITLVINNQAHWSTTCLTGTKPEYGPYFCEFAPLIPGRYSVSPEGLDIATTLDVGRGGVAVVIFEKY